MKTIVEYVEAIKKKLNHKSFYETMNYIGMPRQSWTAIQNGAGVSDKNAIRMASILKIDPVEIMAVSQSLKAKSKETKNVWIKLAKEKETNPLP